MYSKRKKHYEKHNIWRSYSDMMAGLLLLFVLVMCISFMQAQKNYQEKLAEEAAHQLTQEQLMEELAAREEQVASQQTTLDEQSLLLESQQASLDEQSELLASQQEDLERQKALVLSQQSELEKQNSLMLQQQAALDEQEQLMAKQQAELDEKNTLMLQQQAELDEKNTLMLQQQAELDEQEQLMAQQQQKIEQIIGVKADLIADLKQEFSTQDLNVTIDEADGSIALDSNILFGHNENILTDEGTSMLEELLPSYCKVLMDAQYQEYLAEIRVDGYTDTTGDYFYNLQLSQERALAVANCLLSTASESLTEEEEENLRGKLTANGHSMSNPVYDENGEINMDASRRVEIKFSLKDEEMINELKVILDEAAE